MGYPMNREKSSETDKETDSVISCILFMHAYAWLLYLVNICTCHITMISVGKDRRTRETYYQDNIYNILDFIIT